MHVSQDIHSFVPKNILVSSFIAMNKLQKDSTNVALCYNFALKGLNMGDVAFTACHYRLNLGQDFLICIDTSCTVHFYLQDL